MSEERMMILTMLEEGKISSEEASKLLQALDETSEWDYKDENSETEKNFDLEESLKEQDKKLGNAGTNLGDKFSSFFSNLKGNLFGNYETISTTLEKDISHIENPEIHIKSINGSIQLTPWDNKNICLKVVCQYKKGTQDSEDTFYDFLEEDNKIIFSPAYTSNIGIKIEALIPDRMYKKVQLETSNGKIDIKQIETDNLICNTTNGSIIANGNNSKELNLTTKNGKISIENIDSDIIEANSTNSSISIKDVNCCSLSALTKNGKIIMEDIEASSIIGSTSNGKIFLKDIISLELSGSTSNGSIELEDIKSGNINMTTSNGKIICNDILTNELENLDLNTSNASITINFADFSNPIYFDLETSLGTINLEIPNLVYKINKQNKLGSRKIIAHSIEYSEDEKHSKIIAQTSNGSIKII